MAAGVLPEPGTKYGPCTTGCAHRDCAANRRTAEFECRICKKAIGYDRAFYNDGDRVPADAWVHAACYEDECAQPVTVA